jgi:DNA invertase Pin-like site-specific DNA recombinase
LAQQLRYLSPCIRICFAAGVEYQLQRLQSHGVTFHSYTEEYLSTDNELVRNILLAVMSSLAKVEAQRISQRTKAGLALAELEGGCWPSSDGPRF